MGSRLVLGLLVVAAVGAVLWVALSGGDPAAVDPDHAGPAARPDDEVAPPPVVPDASSPAAEPDDPEEPAAKADGIGTLLVTVTDPEKRVLAGCVVTADGRTATTGADGIARFEGLPAGKRISVTAEGPNPLDTERRTRVTLVKDQVKTATLIVYPGGGIRGVVHGPGGGVLTLPFHITIEPTAVVGHREGRLNEQRIERSFPAGDGTFTFPRIRPGGYVAIATAKGLVEGTSEPLRITAGEITDGVEIMLSAGGTVTGVVVDRTTGEPIAGARVGLGNNNHMVFVSSGSDVSLPGDHTTTTDAKGAFRIEGVAPGKYRLMATGEGRTAAKRNDVEVVAGAETGGLRLALGRGATITGTVFGPDGKPQADQTVLVQQVLKQIDFQGDHGRRAKTDANGVYRVEGLEAGRYRVKLPASTRSSEVSIGFSVMGGEEEEEEPDDSPLDPDMVEVKEGQVVTKDLHVELRGAIRGTVKNRKGERIQEMVRLSRVKEKREDPSRPRIEIPRMEFPDGDAKFEFVGLEPGTWRVACGDRSETVEIGPGDERTVDFVLNPARVEGIVVDGSGQGIEGVTVQATRPQFLEDGPFSGGNVSPVRTGKDGRFTFPAVFSGTWTFRAEKNGADGESVAVEVSEGGHVRDVRIELITLTELTVKVVDAEGQPTAGIHVVASSEASGESKYGETNAAGIATVQVRGGTEYKVEAFRNLVRGSATVKVRKGVPARIEITLK